MVTVAEAIEVSKSFKLTFDKPIVATHPNYRDAELSFTEAVLTLTADKAPDGTWRSKRELYNAPTLKLSIPTAVYHKNGEATSKLAFDKRQFSWGSTVIELRSVKDDEVKAEVNKIVNSFWFQLS